MLVSGAETLSSRSKTCSATRLSCSLTRNLRARRYCSSRSRPSAHAALRAIGRPYFATLPPAEDLPLIWPESDLATLVGTGVEEAARARRSRLVTAYTAMIACLKSHGHGSSDLACVLVDAFLSAATLTSSRAFYIDATHGYALVPGADAFNHKCALPSSGSDGGPSSGEEEGSEEEGSEEEGEEEEEDDDEEVEAAGGDGSGGDGGGGAAAADADEFMWAAEEEEDARLANPLLRSAVFEIGKASGLDLSVDCVVHNLEGGEEEGEEGEEEGDGGGGSGDGDGDEGGDDAAPPRHFLMVSTREIRPRYEVCYTYGPSLTRSSLIWVVSASPTPSPSQATAKPSHAKPQAKPRQAGAAHYTAPAAHHHSPLPPLTTLPSNPSPSLTGFVLGQHANPLNTVSWEALVVAGRELLGGGGREGFEQRVSELKGGCGKGGGGGGRSRSTAKQQHGGGGGGGGGGGAATPRWSAALLGRSYTFDHSLQPPPLLLLFLRLITLPLPALRGDGWLDDEGMASEHAGLRLEEQLDRTQCELLLRAIEVQVGRYNQQKDHSRLVVVRSSSLSLGQGDRQGGGWRR